MISKAVDPVLYAPYSVFRAAFVPRLQRSIRKPVAIIQQHFVAVPESWRWRNGASMD